MPKVQQYNPGGTISTAPTQARRLRQVDNNADAIGRGLQQVGGQMFDQAMRQREEDELDQAEEAVIEYKNANIEILHGEEGYFKTSGGAAYDGQQATLEALQERKRQISERLSRGALERFEKASASIDLSTKRSVYTHAEDGRKARSMGIQQSGIESAVEEGAYNYRNDDKINENMMLVREYTGTLSDMEGMDGKVKQERLETATSKYFSVVIGRAIEQEPERGEALIDKYGKYMEVGDLDQAKTDLVNYQRDETVLQTVDTWMGAGVGLGDARELSQSIDDPKTRKQALSEFKTRYREREYEINEQKDDLYNQYALAIEQSDATYSDLPRKSLSNLTPRQRKSLRLLEQQKYGAAKKEAMPMDERIEMLELINSSNPNDRAKGRRKLTESGHLLSQGQQSEYAKMLTKKPDSPEQTRMRTFYSRVTGYAKEIKNDKKSRAFMDASERWLRSYVALNGKEPSPDEEEKQLAWMMTDEDGWGGDDENFLEPEKFNEKVFEDHFKVLNERRIRNGKLPLDPTRDSDKGEVETFIQRLKDRGYYLPNE